MFNPFHSILRAIGLSPKLYYCRDIFPYGTLPQISARQADFSKASGYFWDLELDRCVTY
ncbi:hypothetical protein QUB60_17825 [Microcoleus sp. A2-C5]|uniref:hypothetical protein n=1 Tax=Microcoleus sp. A2-C2 TaxID=2818530 RepID=UPI002FCEF1E4